MQSSLSSGPDLGEAAQVLAASNGEDAVIVTISVWKRHLCVGS